MHNLTNFIQLSTDYIFICIAIVIFLYNLHRHNSSFDRKGNMLYSPARKCSVKNSEISAFSIQFRLNELFALFIKTAFFNYLHYLYADNSLQLSCHYGNVLDCGLRFSSKL